MRDSLNPFTELVLDKLRSGFAISDGELYIACEHGNLSDPIRAIESVIADDISEHMPDPLADWRTRRKIREVALECAAEITRILTYEAMCDA